ncbi:MAG: carboxypeptidase regulatory-like domain-containing protein [Bacteroidia bacterium]
MRRFLLLFFIINSAFIISQTTSGTLKVIVTDENGEDFLGANIAVYQNNVFVKGTASDPFGLATIAFLEPGDYTLKASFVGYATVSQDFSIASNNITTLNIQMQVETEELQEIVIQCIKPLINEAYAGTITKTRESLSKMPTRGTTGVVAVAGGVTSVNGKDPVIRGGRSSQTITYIDGMPVRGSSAMAQSSYGEIQTQFSGTPAKFENATSPSEITGSPSLINSS